MFEDKLIKVMGVSLLGGALLMGCPSGDDDDATAEATETPAPTTAPEATPEYLDFDTVDTYVECTTGTNDWYYQLSLIGWAEDYPYVVVYDNPDWYTGPDDPDLWVEDITLDTLIDQGGDTVNAGYYEVWARDDLQYVDSWDLFTEDYSTIFQCDNIDFLTFVFYASDYWGGWEDCYAIGKYPETFGPDCLY